MESEAYVQEFMLVRCRKRCAGTGVCVATARHGSGRAGYTHEVAPVVAHVPIGRNSVAAATFGERWLGDGPGEYAKKAGLTAWQPDTGQSARREVRRLYLAFRICPPLGRISGQYP